MPVTNIDAKWTGGDLVESGAGAHVPAAIHPGSSQPGLGAGPLLIETTAVAKGATTTTVNTDITLASKVRVYDVVVVQKSTGSTEVRVRVGSTAAAITNTITSTDADKHVMRASTIDDAQWDIPVGSKLRVTAIAASSATIPALSWFVKCHVTT